MRMWKQAVVSLVVLGAAVTLWARYFPVAAEFLERAGIATASVQAPGAAGRTPPARGARRAAAWSSAPPVVAATINDSSRRSAMAARRGR